MRDWRLGWAFGGGSGAGAGAGAGAATTDAEAAEDPRARLASLTSFLHETYVVSPGRSSTVKTCRSPAFITLGATTLEGSPPLLSSIINSGSGKTQWVDLFGSRDAAGRV